jgi:hypothetical protein
MILNDGHSPPSRASVDPATRAHRSRVRVASVSRRVVDLFVCLPSPPDRGRPCCLGFPRAYPRKAALAAVQCWQRRRGATLSPPKDYAARPFASLGFGADHGPSHVILRASASFGRHPTSSYGADCRRIIRGLALQIEERRRTRSHVGANPGQWRRHVTVSSAMGLLAGDRSAKARGRSAYQIGSDEHLNTASAPRPCVNRRDYAPFPPFNPGRFTACCRRKN